MLRQRLLISLFSAVLFLILSLPIVYHFTNKLFASLQIHILDASGNPSMTGLLVHATVFAIITLVVMYI